MLSELKECILSGIPAEDHEEWREKFDESAHPERDLSRVIWEFLIFLVQDIHTPENPEQLQKVTAKVLKALEARVSESPLSADDAVEIQMAAAECVKNNNAISTALYADYAKSLPANADLTNAYIIYSTLIASQMTANTIYYASCVAMSGKERYLTPCILQAENVVYFRARANSQNGAHAVDSTYVKYANRLIEIIQNAPLLQK